MSISLKNAAAAVVQYVLHRVDGAVAIYHGENHSDIAKDQLTLRSDAPVRTRTAYGNRRSVVKLVTAVAVASPDGTSEQKDMKFELSTSVPVGVSVVQVKESIARIAALADNEALVESIVVAGKVQH